MFIVYQNDFTMVTIQKNMYILIKIKQKINILRVNKIKALFVQEKQIFNSISQFSYFNLPLDLYVLPNFVYNNNIAQPQITVKCEVNKPQSSKYMVT